MCYRARCGQTTGLFCFRTTAAASSTSIVITGGNTDNTGENCY